MEEWIGKWWDRFITRVAQRTYPEATVTLSQIHKSLALFYRGCGGPPARSIKPALRRTSTHRRTWLERISGTGDRITTAAVGNEVLYLPAKIDWFPDPKLNREAYYWITLAAAHYIPNGEPVWLANQRAAVVALTRFPAWEKRYRQLVAVLLSQRPDPNQLPASEAALERAIRQALIEPGSCLSFPPLGKHPPFPVLLWLNDVGEMAPEKRLHRDSQEQANPTQPAERRTLTAQRIDAPKEEHGMLLVFRAESLLTWAEYVKVNRCQDDDPGEDAARVADSLDTLHFADDQEKVASRVRLSVETAPGQEENAQLSGSQLLPEWDYRSASYREGFCRLLTIRPNPATQEEISLPPHLLPLIRRVRAQLALLAPVRITLHGQTDGTEIDLDRYVRFHSERLAGGSTADHGLYEVKRSRHRDIATLLLADTSLSTDAYASDTMRVIDVIRDALWVFTEAIAETGDDLALATFSSYRREAVTLQWLKTFAERNPMAVRQRIQAISPGYYTRLGAAIRGAIQTLRTRPNSLKLLFLLSDGKPHDLDGYEGRYAIEDSRMALIEARRAGIRPFCLTIDQEAADYLPYLFGHGGYLLIPRIPTLVERLPTIYAHLTQGL